jgi:hypothetical protein
MIYDIELFLRGLASYFGMSLKEFNKVIDGDPEKFSRFYNDYKYNHN